MTEFWQNDKRLRAVRERIMGHEREIQIAAMNLKEAVRYTDPPDEDAADAELAIMAGHHAAIAREQRELIRLRRLVRREYAQRASLV